MSTVKITLPGGWVPDGFSRKAGLGLGEDGNIRWLCGYLTPRVKHDPKRQGVAALGTMGYFGPRDSTPGPLSGYDCSLGIYQDAEGKWHDYFSVAGGPSRVMEFDVSDVVPEGWEPVRWDHVKAGEYCIMSDDRFVVDIHGTPTVGKWLVVRKTQTWAPFTADWAHQKARFREREEGRWYDGTLCGMGKTAGGRPFFIDEYGSHWKFCEVLV